MANVIKLMGVTVFSNVPVINHLKGYETVMLYYECGKVIKSRLVFIGPYIIQYLFENNSQHIYSS